MDKKEFMDILRQSLQGEVDDNIIEQNIRFYNEYISSQRGKNESEVIKEIGDPRLIAKTIIETAKASDNSESGDWNNVGSNRSYSDEYAEKKDYYRGHTHNKRVYHLKWYHMLLILLVLFFLIFVLIRISWIIIKLLFAFIVPIIFIGLLLTLFRKR